MRNVPAVAYPVGRSRQLAFGLLALWWVGAAVVACWWVAQGIVPSFLEWRMILLLLALVLTGAALWSFWCSQARCRLVFDGDQWQLEGHEGTLIPGERTQVAIAFDGQRRMLLRWPAVPRKGQQLKWLWAEASSDPLRWHLLRCALYSPANRPTCAGAGGNKENRH